MISGVPIWTGGPAGGPEKSGSFPPAFSVARSVAAGRLRQAGQTRGQRPKTPGAARQVNRQAAGLADNGSGATPSSRPRPWRRRKRAARETASRAGGSFTRPVQSPGSLIYTPHIAPGRARADSLHQHSPQGRGTASRQGHSHRATGASQQTAGTSTAHRAGASRSQRQGHSLQPHSTQRSQQHKANRQQAHEHQNACARFLPNAPARESRRARARVGTPGGPVKVAGAEAQNFFRYEGVFFHFPCPGRKNRGGVKKRNRESEGGRGNIKFL